MIREIYKRLWNKNISNAWELYDIILNTSSSKLVIDYLSRYELDIAKEYTAKFKKLDPAYEALY